MNKLQTSAIAVLWLLHGLVLSQELGYSVNEAVFDCFSTFCAPFICGNLIPDPGETTENCPHPGHDLEHVAAQRSPASENIYQMPYTHRTCEA